MRVRGRIYLRTDRAEKTAQALERVFGVSTVSPAKQTKSEFSAIAETALALADAIILENSSFAVRCHRVGVQPYSSMELCRELGSQILESFKKRNLRVNLTSPNVTVNVEVRDKEAYVYSETLRGAGGFPMGTQGKTVCLLSGGIDSPVACWLVMKRGSPTIPIYVDQAPYTDTTTRERAIRTARKLQEWSAGFMKKIYIVPNGENMQTIQKKAPEKFTCLMCKRLMYLIAERIAQKEEAYGIVTGEAIGEQASQTMHNLFAIDEVAKLYPIHRPLLGFDKLETEAIARRIGTFEVSIEKAKGCTAAPSMPATQAKLMVLKNAEAELNMAEMADRAVQAAEILEL